LLKETNFNFTPSIFFPLLWKKHQRDFALFHQFKIKVNLIQNSAISFSVCVEDKFDNFKALNAILSKKIQSRI
jgi:hypothetical protein